MLHGKQINFTWRFQQFQGKRGKYIRTLQMQGLWKPVSLQFTYGLLSLQMSTTGTRKMQLNSFG